MEEQMILMPSGITERGKIFNDQDLYINQDAEFKDWCGVNRNDNFHFLAVSTFVIETEITSFK